MNDLTTFIVSVDFIDFKRNNRDFRMLKYKGHKFGLNGVSQAYPTRSRWRCTGYRNFRCPVTVITYNDNFICQNHQHNHRPLDQCRILETYARLIRTLPRSRIF